MITNIGLNPPVPGSASSRPSNQGQVALPKAKKMPKQTTLFQDRVQSLLEQTTQFYSLYSRYEGWKDFVIEYTMTDPLKEGFINKTVIMYRTIQESLTLEFMSQVLYHNEHRKHVWFGSAPRYMKLGCKSGCNQDIPLVYCIKADFDNIDTKEELIVACNAVNIPTPTIIGNSSHKIHAYWFLKDPINPKLSREIEKYMCKILFPNEGMDKRCIDQRHVMRLLGTQHPGEPSTELKAIKLPAWSGIIEINKDAYYTPQEILGDRKPYCLDQIYQEWIEPTPQKEDKRKFIRQPPLQNGFRTPLNPTQQKTRQEGKEDKRKFIRQPPLQKASLVICKVLQAYLNEPPLNVIPSEDVSYLNRWKATRSRKSSQIDYYSETSIIESEGSRNSSLMLLIRRIMNEHGPNFNGYLEIVDEWFINNQHMCKSGIMQNRKEAIRCWKSLSKKHDPSRRTLNFKIIEHPNRNEIPEGHYQLWMQNAMDFIYSGIQAHGKEFFAAYSVIAQHLGISKAKAGIIMQKVMKLGFVKERIKGSRSGQMAGKGTFWDVVVIYDEKDMVGGVNDEEAIYGEPESCESILSSYRSWEQERAYRWEESLPEFTDEDINEFYRQYFCNSEGCSNS